MTTPLKGVSLLIGCRICGEKDFKIVIDMGLQPKVNSLLNENDGIGSVASLVVEQCQTCFLVQVRDNLSADSLYREEDYLYFSGDMPGLASYFEQYAHELIKRFENNGDFVIEIGSNDGTMLQFFDYPKLGIDPSTNVVVRAIARGIPTISDFFTERLANSVVKEMGQAGLIYANNCIAHSEDLHTIMKGVVNLLQDTGVFAVECNYWGAKKSREKTKELKQLISSEKKDSLASYNICERFHNGVFRKAALLESKVKGYKKSGKTVAGYGAAAKGFSLLSLANITTEIDYFVDDSPAKQGKYTSVVMLYPLVVS